MALGFLKRTLTDKIGDIASDRNLATEPATIQLTLTEHSPRLARRVPHLAPQRPCSSNGAVNRAVDRMSSHAPFATGTITPTQPSPIEGEGFRWSRL